MRKLVRMDEKEQKCREGPFRTERPFPFPHGMGLSVKEKAPEVKTSASLLGPWFVPIQVALP